jgi:hypothetical protein
MWYNGPMAWLLRSPLHRLVSKNMMLLTYLGRKSGKRYDVPVSYVQDGDGFSVTSMRERTWWRNLRGGAGVRVQLAGAGTRGHRACHRGPRGGRRGAPRLSTTDAWLCPVLRCAVGFKWRARRHRRGALRAGTGHDTDRAHLAARGPFALQVCNCALLSERLTNHIGHGCSGTGAARIGDENFV